MQHNRNITPGAPEKKRINSRLILKRSLVSDRLGAQGFEEQNPPRETEPSRATKPEERRPNPIENN